MNLKLSRDRKGACIELSEYAAEGSLKYNCNVKAKIMGVTYESMYNT